jgi:D-beta-D-heptose 7-phosphate kinase/D-beta-D-heptose 1-phosphate adenosyltransferase
VYDVTGAGDMFLAGLAAARANGIGWEDAVRFANAAAGLEVELFGVVPIPFEKVRQEILLRSGRAMGKVRSLEQVMAEVERRRGPWTVESGRQSRRANVVFTNGCFDIIHAGHVALIERAARLGDFLIIGLNSDSSVRELKGAGRPVNTQDDRARVLGAIDGVDAIVIFEEQTPIKLIEAIRPDVLVKGSDYTKDRVVGGALVESYGGRVELVPLVEGKSTTGILNRAGA